MIRAIEKTEINAGVDFFMNRILTAVLVVLMVIGSFACTESDEPDKSGETADQTGATESADNSAENQEIKDNLPELNFDGQTIVIHTRDDYNAVDEILVEDTSNQVFDAIYRRNLAVEERLGVRIEVFRSASWASYYTTANSQLRAAINAGDTAFDIVSGWQPCIPELAAEGLFTNLLADTYVDTSMPWWTRSLVDELTVGDTLYFVTGDISPFTMLGCMRVFVCNMNMADAYHIENLYDVVNRGDWTIEYLTDIAKNIYTDDGNSLVDAGDTFGLQMGCSNDVDGFIASARIKMTGRDEDNIPYMEMPVEKMETLVEKLYNLMYGVEGTFVTPADAGDISFQMMQENRLLLASYPVDTLRIALNELESDFMVLPYPKLDENQEKYGTRIQDALQIWGIPIDIIGDRLDAASATLEAMACESYNKVTSVYFDTALKGRYTRDEESGAMMDLIKDSVFFSFEMIYNNLIGNPCYVLRNILGSQSNNFTTWWAKREIAVDELLNTVIDQFLEANSIS